MRRFNSRLFGGLLLVLIVGTGCLVGLHRWQMSRYTSVYKKQAERAVERGEIANAITHYRRYITLAPDDQQALSDFGLLLEKSRLFDQAYLTLERALRVEPSRDDLRKAIVRSAVALGRYPDAISYLKPLIDANPKDHELLTLKAISQHGQRNYQEATVTLREAIAANPNRPELYLQLFSILDRELKDQTAASTVLDDMVKQNPDKALAWRGRGEWRVLRKNYDGAFSDASEAFRLAPEVAANLTLLIRAELGLNKLAEARAHGEQLFKQNPGQAATYRTLADIELAGQNPDGAVTWLKRGHQVIPSDNDLTWNIAALSLDRGITKDVPALLDQLRANKYPSGPVQFLSGRVAVLQGQWLQASQLFEVSRSELQAWPDLLKQTDFWLGQCYRELGNTDQQLTAMRRATGHDPAWAPARMGVAEALIATGRLQQAAEEYRVVASQPNAPLNAVLQFVRLTILEMLQRPKPQQNWPAVETALTQLETYPEAVPTARILRAEIAVAQDKDDEARQILADARKASPDNFSIRSAEIAMAQRSRDWPLVETLLKETREQLKDNYQLRLAEAQALAYRDGNKATAALEKLAETPADWTAQEKTELLSGLAYLEFALGDYERAGKLANQVAAQQPTNLRIRMLMMDIAFRTQSDEQMLKALNEVKSIEGTGPLWHYFEAVRNVSLAAKGQPEVHYQKALDQLAEARIARPGWSRIPLMIAEINERQGRKQAAADRYLEAVQLGERQPAVINKTITLLFEQRRFVEADQLVRGFQEQQSPFSGDLMRMASEVSLRLEDFGRALELAQQIAANSDRYVDHLWLGQVQALLRRFEDSEAQFRKAISLDPTRPEAWTSLVQVQALLNQPEKALATLAEAEKAIDPDEATLAIAQSFEILKKPDEAALRFKSALESQPNNTLVLRRAVEFYLRNGQQAEAMPLLTRLVDDSFNSDENLQMWAKRNLALALASQPGIRSAREALKILADEEIAKDPSLDRVRAFALSRTSLKSDMATAIAILQKLVTQPGNEQVDDQFLLADLSMRAGDRRRYIELMRSVLAQKAEPRTIRHYVEYLLTNNELSEAENWLLRLPPAGPMDLQQATMTARLKFGRKQYQDLLDYVSEVATETKGLTDETARQSRITAGRLWASRVAEEFAAKLTDAPAEQQKLLALAEEQWKQLAAQSPDLALGQAGFLIRQNRLADAMPVLTANWDQARDIAVIPVTTDLMEIATIPEDVTSALNPLLESRLAKAEPTADLLNAIANLMSWTGQYDRATALYRKALEKNPDDLAALNNLAALLASRGTNLPEALDLINKAISSAGPLGALLDTRGMVQLASNNLSAAKADFQASIQEGGSGERYFHLAVCQHRAGESKISGETLQQARALGLKIEKLHPLERPLLSELLALHSAQIDAPRNGRQTELTRN